MFAKLSEPFWWEPTASEATSSVPSSLSFASPASGRDPSVTGFFWTDAGSISFGQAAASSAGVSLLLGGWCRYQSGEEP